MRLYRLLLHALSRVVPRRIWRRDVLRSFARRSHPVKIPAGLLLWFEDVLTSCSRGAGTCRHPPQDVRYTAAHAGPIARFTLTAIWWRPSGSAPARPPSPCSTCTHPGHSPSPDQDGLVKLYEDHSFSAGRLGLAGDAAPANYPRDWKRLSILSLAWPCIAGSP